jgi:two-component system OmpR family response regulator
MQEIARGAREAALQAEADMRRLLTDQVRTDGTEGHPHTILVAEDDSATRMAVESWLRLRGFSVQTAANASEAAVHLDDPEEAIDVAVVDIGLPDMDGVALCEVIHQFHPFLPVVIFSGRATPEDVRRVMGAGARRFFTKPVDPTELETAVEATLP